MANQAAPSSRPWIRLGSMRASAPPPAPAAPTPTPASPTLQDTATPAVPAETQPPPAPPRAIVRPAALGARPTPAPRPFRLGSISVPSSPVKTSTASVPSSPVAWRPGFSSVPSSPILQKGATTALSSLPTSPVQEVSSPATKVISTVPPPPPTGTVPEPAPAAAAAPAPAPPPPVAVAPQFFKLPVRTTAPPPPPPVPSLLILPPAQVKSAPEPIEQKSVLVVEKPKSQFKPSLGVGGGPQTGDTLKLSDLKAQKGHDLKKSDLEEDATTKIITLAGNNTGAVMELSPARKKLDPKKSSPKSWWASKSGTDSSDGEKSKDEADHNMKMGGNTSTRPPMNAFMNSNVQAVNNSILFNASCHHHDPGVHVSFTRRAGPSGRALHLKNGGDVGQDKN